MQIPNKMDKSYKVTDVTYRPIFEGHQRHLSPTTKRPHTMNIDNEEVGRHRGRYRLKLGSNPSLELSMQSLYGTDPLFNDILKFTALHGIERTIDPKNPSSPLSLLKILQHAIYSYESLGHSSSTVELRSLKLGDLSIDAYFWKIESLATILISLGSPVSSEDVLRLLSKACPTSTRTCVNSKSQSLPMDFTSSSPMLLMAQSGINHRSFTPQVKTLRPCYNFARGSCQFGGTCRFVHDPSMQAKSTSNSLWSSSSNLSGVSNNKDPSGSGWIIGMNTYT
ncbi:ribonuclease H-like domain-containing protein [Tanacetum coccineum]|uniref:Ribonuclease H-like domain-containing protein n=1 Tax=Tanacetum coccineum TaxID=301880 RepID=A0ABQ5F403_9ASTR